ncbi:MAG: DMT family transporter [Anaerolineales bacterium]|nr:DMT family transporter [Anaerolineales bacterium]
MAVPAILPDTNPRIKADLTLLLVSSLWGSAFVAQRIAAQNMSIFLFNGLRFLFGALVLVPFLARVPRPRFPQERKTWLGLLLAGLCLYGGTTLQQLGIRYTTATNAGFITGLYVVIVPILLTLGLRQQPRGVVWLASLLAALGMYLLSTQGSFTFAPGDGLVLAGSLLWALHVIVIGWLARRMQIYPLAVGQFLICSALHLSSGLLIEGAAMFAPGVVWGAVLYTSLFSIGMGFTLQAIAQRVAPPADAAIILCGEAVFAAFFGWAILDERLSVLQIVGSACMLAGMLLAQVDPSRNDLVDIPLPRSER